MRARICCSILALVLTAVCQVNPANALPVEFRFSGGSEQFSDLHFSGRIIYDTETFFNVFYSVSPATVGSYPPCYAGRSSYIQSAPSASIFNFLTSTWEGFDVSHFNSATNFVNRIDIETIVDSGPPRSAITFSSISDEFSLVMYNVHMEVHALAYAVDQSIYDLPTAATPFWPWEIDYSEYRYVLFQQGEFYDGGVLGELTPIPEAGTVLMLGAGFVGVALYCRRRSRS